MDNLVYEITQNFLREMELFKAKDSKSLFLQYFQKKGVSNPRILPTKDQSIAVGSLNGSSVDGEAIVQYFNKTVYVGTLLNGERHGFGWRTYFNSELIYEGEYKLNLKCGKGKLFSPSRKMWVFEGLWDRDMKNGQGEMWRERVSYFGNWVDDKMSGKGKMKWIDGQEYEGLFSNDYRNGEGIMYYANGDSYSGFFKNGRPDGKGTYRWANGEFYEGTWSEGRMEGDGQIHYQLPVSAVGMIKMNSIQSLNFDLLDHDEWENKISKSEIKVKTFKSQISTRDLDDDNFRISSKNVSSVAQLLTEESMIPLPSGKHVDNMPNRNSNLGVNKDKDEFLDSADLNGVYGTYTDYSQPKSTRMVKASQETISSMFNPGRSGNPVQQNRQVHQNELN